MKKNLPLLLLASTTLLLSGCGKESDSNSNIPSGSDLKFATENILAYNLSSQMESLPTANKLEVSPIKKLVEETKREIVKPLNLTLNTHQFLVTKSTDVNDTDSINKYAIYSLSASKEVTPFAFSNDDIKGVEITNDDSGNNDAMAIYLFYGRTAPDKFGIYDAFGNLVEEIKAESLTIKEAAISKLEIPGKYENFEIRYKVNDELEFHKFHYKDGVIGKGKLPSEFEKEDLKPGDLITPQKFSIPELNLPEYSVGNLGDKLIVYKGEEVVTSYKFPNIKSTPIMLDGYLFYQDSIKVHDLETDFDYYKEDETNTIHKYRLNTYKFDVLTGKTECFDFPYLFEIPTKEEDLNLKNKDGAFTYSIIPGRVISKDKILGDKVRYVFNNKLEVVNDYTDINFESLTKFGEGFVNINGKLSITYYDEKENPKFIIDEETIPALKEFTFSTVENKFLAWTDNNKVYSIDTSGQILKEYDEAYSLLNVFNGSKFITINEEGTILSINGYKEGVEKIEIVSLLDDKYETAFHYETATEHVISDFSGNKVSYKKESLTGEFKIEAAILPEYNLSLTVFDGETVLDYLRVDSGYNK